MGTGLTDQGFERDTLEEIVQSVKDDLWTSISNKLDLSSESPLGQATGILCERFDSLSQLGEAIYNAFRPGASSGTNLAALSTLTGTVKKSATQTIVKSCVVNVDNGFSQAPGTMFAALDTDPTKRFMNIGSVQNSSGVTANVTVDFVAEIAGPTEVLASHLSSIAEPISGWNSITNPTDGETGDPDETDSALRLRREEELRAQGSTNADAIQADVLRNLKNNVTHCRVLANPSDVNDANGVLPHSVETIARGKVTDISESTRLAKQIMASKSGGTRASGVSSLTMQDSQGNDINIGYTWVTDSNVWIEIDIKVDSTKFPQDGDQQLINAILLVEAEEYQPGSDVVAERLKAVGFTIPGITDVPAFRLGLAAHPVGTANLPIDIRQQAKLDSSRILVTHV
jgi:hypothetical protein